MFSNIVSRNDSQESVVVQTSQNELRDTELKIRGDIDTMKESLQKDLSDAAQSFKSTIHTVQESEKRSVKVIETINELLPSLKDDISDAAQSFKSVQESEKRSVKVIETINELLPSLKDDIINSIVNRLEGFIKKECQKHYHEAKIANRRIYEAIKNLSSRMPGSDEFEEMKRELYLFREREKAMFQLLSPVNLPGISSSKSVSSPRSLREGSRVHESRETPRRETPCHLSFSGLTQEELTQEELTQEELTQEELTQEELTQEELTVPLRAAREFTSQGEPTLMQGGENNNIRETVNIRNKRRRRNPIYVEVENDQNDQDYDDQDEAVSDDQTRGLATSDITQAEVDMIYDTAERLLKNDNINSRFINETVMNIDPKFLTTTIALTSIDNSTLKRYQKAIPDNKSTTLLHIATMSDSISIDVYSHWLSQFEASDMHMFKDGIGNTLLIIAVYLGKCDKVSFLLESKMGNLRARSTALGTWKQALDTGYKKDKTLTKRTGEDLLKIFAPFRFKKNNLDA